MNAQPKPLPEQETAEAPAPKPVEVPAPRPTPAPAPAPAAAPAEQPAQATPAGKRRRRGRRLLLMLLVPVVLAVGGGWIWLSGGRYESTENANLHFARVEIASDISGRLTEVDVTDNAHVKTGDVLFRIDPKPFQLALGSADAALASARLQVEQLKAAYAQAKAQEGVSRDDVAYLNGELDRQKALVARGVTTSANLDNAEHELRQAKEKLSAAEQATASALAALGGDPEIETDSHPAVLAALSTRDTAAYNLQLTTVRAPADGVVYQAASFRLGGIVSAGVPLFALVETDDAWVDANFKETQLTSITAGQSAEVEFDIYPGRTFTARVDAIGAGTGSEFSLLPAQNATGNWVKVVQRVPVRLALEDVPPDLTLVSGASATVKVDTRQTRSLPWLSALAGN